MPWKDRYTISDERGIADAEISWPGGARCCMRVVVDLSPLSGPAGIGPADVATPEAQFGANGALAALREMFSRFDIRATLAVPAVLAGISRRSCVR